MSECIYTRIASATRAELMATLTNRSTDAVTANIVRRELVSREKFRLAVEADRRAQFSNATRALAFEVKQ